MTRSLPRLIARGESGTLELERSTGELRQAMQTLYAFANGEGKGKGGRVILGVKPSGEFVGQQVSEQTFNAIATQRDRFEPPIEFEEITGAAVVTFRVPVAGAESEAESLDGRILETLRTAEQSKSGLATKLGLSSVTGQLNRAVAALLERGLVEMTIPDKPNSRLQKYRLTAAGRAAVAAARGA